MPTDRTAAQQAASRANGARSRGPVTDTGKARSARNGTKHGLRGGPFALLPGESFAGFAALHAAVAADWRPRDAYEKRWVVELVAAMWRQDRLRAIELATLTAVQGPASEALVKQLLTFARYGARIDKDMAKALQALRALRNRPDAELDACKECKDCTCEPGQPEPTPRNFTNDLSPRTPEPGDAAPEPLPADGTPEPGPAAPLNRHQRRALAAMRRRRAA